VRRGLAASREQAAAAVANGAVLVSGAPADKPSRLVGQDEPVVLTRPRSRFVSRGGAKLDAALERFAIDVAGRRCLDAGASTGGFTDCLLQRGAASVTAVDVGRGQLHQRLRADPRVHSLERTDVRRLTLEDLGGPPAEVVVADLSFISLRLVAPTLLGALAATAADVVILIKPQFEAGRAEVSRGKGVITDPACWARVLETITSALVAERAAMMGVMVSPITGADGNVEFLAHLRAHASEAGGAVDLGGLIDEALRLRGPRP